MPESPRIACCIRGCRCTAPRTTLDDGDTEILCAKHYRADRALVQTRNMLKARERGIRRLLQKGFDRGEMSEVRCDRIWALIQRHLALNWNRIKANSQRLQDSGYWSRRPARKTKGGRPPKQTGRLTDAFEREFQRAKNRGSHA